ncbi:hypothetical protein EPN87_02065 [archaeon]|nr:MAG: hypothetical protein EPN87_02065 [archaeon]
MKIAGKVNGAIGNLTDFEWKHRNIIYFAISILASVYLIQNSWFIGIVTSLGSFGYMGSFLAGLGFSYAMTSPLATISIYALGKTLPPLYIAFLGAFGAMASDFVIFKFFRDKLMKEIRYVAKDELHLRFPKISKWVRSKYLSLLVSVFAGLIIASPLPDEAGMLLLASVKYKVKNVLMLSYWLNFLGIFAIALLGSG